MRIIFMALATLLVSSCSQSIKKENELGYYQINEMLIPKIELDNLVMKESFSREEIARITEKFANLRSKSSPPEVPPNYFVCGGIFFSGKELYDRGSKFKIIGVTERWIPIEGKVTKVLYLKAVD